MKHIAIVLAAVVATAALVACGVGLPTPAVDLPAQEVWPTATPTATPTPTPAPVQTANSATHWAMANFGAIVSDARVQALLEKHGATPFKAHVVIGEFAGSSSSSGPVAPSDFVVAVRSNLANGFAPDVGDGMTLRSRNFLSEHTADAITSDPQVRQDAASLLGLYDKLNAAVQSIERGTPIIYAVEVQGVEARLRQLGEEESIKDFGMVPLGSAPNWDPPSAESLRDAPSVGPPGASGASGASEPNGQALYNRLSAFASRELTPQPTATPTPTPTPTSVPDAPPGPVSGQ